MKSFLLALFIGAGLHRLSAATPLSTSSYTNTASSGVAASTETPASTSPPTQVTSTTAPSTTAPPSTAAVAPAGDGWILGCNHGNSSTLHPENSTVISGKTCSAFIPSSSNDVSNFLQNIFMVTASVCQGGVTSECLTYDISTRKPAMVSLLRQADCKSKSSSWISAYNTVNTTSSFSTTMGVETYAEGLVTIAANATVQTMLTFPSNPTTKNPHYCCGPCAIQWADVEVFYWLEPDANTQCLTDIDTKTKNEYVQAFTIVNEMISKLAVSWTGESSSATTSAGTSSPSALARRNLASTGIFTKGTASSYRNGTSPTYQNTTAPIYTNGTFPGQSNNTVPGPRTAVGKDGFTYTSPYIYFNIPWAKANDECGAVGTDRFSLRTSLLPKDVSSVVPKDISCFGAALMTPQNSVWPQTACPMVTEQFNFADLPCPPDSLRSWGHSSYIYNTKNPYLPFIAFPDLTLLDPAWKTCTAMPGWDPYTALTPASALLASATPASDESTPKATAGQGIDNPLPTTTPATAWVATSQTGLPNPKNTKSSTAKKTTTQSHENSTPVAVHPVVSTTTTPAAQPTPDIPAPPATTTSVQRPSVSTVNHQPKESSSEIEKEPTPEAPTRDIPLASTPESTRQAPSSKPSNPVAEQSTKPVAPTRDVAEPTMPVAAPEPAVPTREVSEPVKPGSSTHPAASPSVITATVIPLASPQAPPASPQANKQSVDVKDSTNSAAPTRDTPAAPVAVTSSQKTSPASNSKDQEPAEVKDSPSSGAPVRETPARSTGETALQQSPTIKGSTPETSVAPVGNVPGHTAPQSSSQNSPVPAIPSVQAPAPTVAVPSKVQVIAGGHTLSQAPGGSAIVIGSSTVPYGAKFTSSGVAISIQTDGNVVIHSSAAAQSPPSQSAAAAAPSAITTAGHTFSQAEGGAGVVIGTSAVAYGGAVTSKGVAISVGTGGDVIIDSSTVASLPPSVVAPALPAITTAGHTLSQAQGEAGVVIGVSTVAYGGVITSSGVRISVGTGGDVVFGSKTIASFVPSSDTIASVPTITAAGHTIGGAVSGPGVDVDGWKVGYGSKLTLGTDTISVDSSGHVAVGSSTVASVPPSISTSADPTITSAPTIPPVTTAGHTFGPALNGAGIDVDGWKVGYGSAVTLKSDTISVDTNGNIAMNSKTVAYVPPATPEGMVVGGSTVLDGASATIGGTVVAVEGGTKVVVGGSTVDVGTGGQMSAGGMSMSWTAVAGSASREFELGGEKSASTATPSSDAGKARGKAQESTEAAATTGTAGVTGPEASGVGFTPVSTVGSSASPTTPAVPTGAGQKLTAICLAWIPVLSIGLLLVA